MHLKKKSVFDFYIFLSLFELKMDELIEQMTWASIRCQSANIFKHLRGLIECFIFRRGGQHAHLWGFMSFWSITKSAHVNSAPI